MVLVASNQQDYEYDDSHKQQIIDHEEVAHYQDDAHEPDQVSKLFHISAVIVPWEEDVVAINQPADEHRAEQCYAEDVVVDPVAALELDDEDQYELWDLKSGKDQT